MDIFAVAIAAVALGIVVALITGQPLVILIAMIVGALIANRRGYRHQGKAIRGDLQGTASATPAASARRDIEDRLAEVERLRTAGAITGGEADTRRAAILAEL